MEQFIKDLQSICRQYGHKVDTINPTIDSDGKILDVTIYMEEEDSDPVLGRMLDIPDLEIKGDVVVLRTPKN